MTLDAHVTGRCCGQIGGVGIITIIAINTIITVIKP